MATPKLLWVKQTWYEIPPVEITKKIDGRVRIFARKDEKFDGEVHVVHSNTNLLSSKVELKYMPWKAYFGTERIILFDLYYGTEGKMKNFSTKRWVDEELGIQYIPDLLSVSSISHSVEAIEGGSQVSSCTVVIQNVRGTISGQDDDIIPADREYINTFTFRDRYKIKNRLARIWIVYEGYPSTKQLIFEGKIQDDTINNQEWQLTIEDSYAKYDQTLPKNLFNTEDYPNLEEGRAGIPIPYGFGKIEKAIATEIDTQIHKYKISDLAVKEFDDIYIKSGNEENERRFVFKIKYTGAKALAYYNCSRNGRLTVILGDADGTNPIVDLDINLSDYTLSDTEGDGLVKLIDSLGSYTCTLIIQEDEAKTINASVLREIYDVNIKTNFVQIETGGTVYHSIKAVCDITTYKDQGEFVLNLDAFSVIYTGSESNCYFNISDNKILNIVSGDSNELVNIDLTHYDYDTIFKLRNYLNGLSSYTCGALDSGLNEVPSALLKKALDIEIKAVAYDLYLANPEKGTVMVDYQGVPDTASGTYTGSANALIERPCDIARYIFQAILGASNEDLQISSFENARTGVWKGFEFRRHLKNLDTSFNVLSDLAKEAYAWIYVDQEGELKWANKKGDTLEEIDNRYYESGQFPRIQEDTFGKSASLRDLWNKIEVNYAFVQDRGEFDKLAKFENLYSQSDINGYGTTNTFKQDCYWIPNSIKIATIKHNSENCKFTILGGGSELLSAFRTEVTDSLTLDIDISLEDVLYSTVTKLKSYLEATGDYTVTLEDNKYGNLESMGLLDVIEYYKDGGGEIALYFNFAKLFGIKWKRRYSILLDEVDFGTNLFGLHQNLAKPVMVRGYKEESDKRYRVISIDSNVDNFQSSIVVEYEPRCECFNMCYGYHSCVCDSECYGDTSCVCDQLTYPPQCVCDGTCYSYVACTCDVSCDTQGADCSCDNTCYEHHGCTCDMECHNFNCTCDMSVHAGACSCYGVCYLYQACTCDNTCYIDNPCSCDNTCYQQSCLCDHQCYGQFGCTCDLVCYQEFFGFCVSCFRRCYLQVCEQGYNNCWGEDAVCTCYYTCYVDSPCGCDAPACYGYSPCTNFTDTSACIEAHVSLCACYNTIYNSSCACDDTCYGFGGCTCNNTCYGDTGCTCNAPHESGSCSCESGFSTSSCCDGACYIEATPCTCNQACHNEEVPCNCNYTIYGG